MGGGSNESKKYFFLSCLTDDQIIYGDWGIYFHSLLQAAL